MPFEKGHEYAWKKGQSGNPKGRPKGSLSIKNTMRQYMEKKVKDVDPLLVSQLIGKNEDFAKTYGNMKLREAYAISLIRQGLKGRFELLEHLEGKPAQNINLGGQEDNPIEIKINHVKPDIKDD